MEILLATWPAAITAALIAAMVSLIVAFINALSARRLDMMRAYREHIRKDAEPAFERLDGWYRTFSERETRTAKLRFLNETKPDLEETRAWIAFKVATASEGKVGPRVRQFEEAREFLRRRLEEDMAGPRASEIDPSLAYLEAQADLMGGVTRGEIEVYQAYRDLRRAMVRALFKNTV